jgi:hypothetical protein
MPSSKKWRRLPWLAGISALTLGVLTLLFYLRRPPMAPLDQSHLPTGVATGPLRVSAANPRYFTDASGRPILLTGSHTWSNFQDNGGSNPPPAFDYTTYLNFLQANHHNFIRLWNWEQSRWTAETSDDNYWFNPMSPFQRTGPGTALDGLLKFDLTRFDQSYFDRLRQRVVEAGQRGMYVSIQLFNGWSVDPKVGWGGGKNMPWKGHPFNKNNNVNGIDGDTNGDNIGVETEDLSIPAVTAIQDAYVKKVVDTVNDLDNVLYEICNECADPASVKWQYHMIDLIHAYEAGKPKQHPVGMTHVSDVDTALFASNADWVSPGGYPNNPAATTGGKVVMADSDHLRCCVDRVWVWEAFTRGYNPQFMDGYDGAGYGVGGAGYNFNDPRWVSLRLNLGYVRSYANRINLDRMTPHGELASTGYALADPAAANAKYLVYLPSGATATAMLRTLGLSSHKLGSIFLPPDGSVTVDLSATAGTLHVEWFDPGNGMVAGEGTVVGGEKRTFHTPFWGDAVLYLYKS